MRKLVLLMFCYILTGSVFATDWIVDLGDWDVDANWSEGKPIGTNGYINLTRTDAVCNLDTDEGLIDNRWMQQNGNVLNILDGGRFGARWARVGRSSAAYVNMSGNGTYVMYDDDLYVGLESGYCEWIMSDTSSLILDTDDGEMDEELYIAEDGGDGLFTLIGSGVTVSVDRIHLTANSAGGTATLEYVMDAGSASTIVAQRTYVGESGDAHLVLSAPGVTLDPNDIVLIESTSGYDVEGPGFATMNGGPATEGSIVVVAGNVYALSYVYDANGDSENNDVALVFVQSAKYLATDPNPANGSTLSVSPTALSWTNPDPNDGVSDITCTVYFGMAPADPNRTGMDSKTLPANVSTIDINATNFPNYGAQPIEDVNDFYWVVDCVDASPGVDPAVGKAPTSWTFSTYYNQAPEVDAGSDDIVYGDGENYPTVDLAGSASDPDEGPGSLEVEWTIADGPDTAVINNPNDTSTTVTVTESGVYVFELTAYDGLAYVSDTVQIIVGINSCEASFLNGSDYNSKDFDQDCDVDLVDFADFAADWLACTNTLEGC